ncbi:hypothetical protein [Streptomyces sp. NPDC058373]|uniref:hypothetical protein n=1 Tax=Streptomyces sp. NPDC058373 TaxID=3346465 RepID=UPI0036500812
MRWTIRSTRARRTTRAVELLRKSGYQVDVDPALAPSPTVETGPTPERVPFGAPDVAFAEHPQFGVIAAVDDRAFGRTVLALVENGWDLHPSLDIYMLPAATDREEALGRVANATVALQGSGIEVAVHPRLAQDIAARHRPAPLQAEPRERSQGAPRASSVSAVALAASPTRARRPGKTPVPDPVAPAVAVRPVVSGAVQSCAPMYG